MTPLTMLGRYPTRFVSVTQITTVIFQGDSSTRLRYFILFCHYNSQRKCATKLQGLVDALSCGCKICDHAVLHAPVEPGIQKINV